MTGFRISDRTQRLEIYQPFALESGDALSRVSVAYRTWGKLNAAADNVIFICHALTGSADADEWWEGLFGPGKALDPLRYFIVCSNALGSCYGTTGPASLAEDGRPWGSRFPKITVRDQVRLQILLATHLGINRIQLVIGGSMGGLQALEWPLLDPQRVKAVASIAAAGQHPAWCQAWSEAQRLALRSDPLFKDGNYPPEHQPRQGLAAARAVAMVSYRSPQALKSRFPRQSNDNSGVPEDADLPVRAWLRHHGQTLVERFDANSYLCLIDAMDTHDLGRGRGEYASVLRQLCLPVFIGGISSDALYVPEEQRALARRLPSASYHEVHSPEGHDGFLINASEFNLPLRQFLSRLEATVHGASDKQQELPRDIAYRSVALQMAI